MPVSPTNTTIHGPKKPEDSRLLDTRPSLDLMTIRNIRQQTALIQSADADAIRARVKFAVTNDQLDIVAKNLLILLKGTQQDPEAEYPRSADQIKTYKKAFSLFITNLVEIIGADATKEILDKQVFSKEGMSLNDPANKWCRLETDLILSQNAHRNTIAVYADSISRGDPAKFNTRFEAMINKISPGGRAAIDVFMQEIESRNKDAKIETAIKAIENPETKLTISESWERLVAEREETVAIADEAKKEDRPSIRITSCDKPKSVDQIAVSAAKYLTGTSTSTKAHTANMSPGFTSFADIVEAAKAEGHGRGG